MHVYNYLYYFTYDVIKIFNLGAVNIIMQSVVDSKLN